MKRVAVVGAGISGLSAAHALAGVAHVTLFEAGGYFGGHTHTVDVTLPVQGRPVTHGVDTGFLVFNERTYPQLVRLLASLDVATSPSDMSFSVQVPGPGGPALEWAGNNLASVFAQRRNLLRPRFLRMLADILRFNRLATGIATRGDDSQLAEPIASFLQRHGFSSAFRDWYFLPMIGCIWSCPADQMLRFPVATMIRFCHNHGLLQVADRPQWHTVRGGAKHYVAKLLQQIPDARLRTPVRRVQRVPASAAAAAGGRVLVTTDHGTEAFDDVVLACHSRQGLDLLADATPSERATLGAIRTQPNRALLHTDVRVLPQRRQAWAAWNYARAVHAQQEQAAVCLHYLINRLQPLPWEQPVIVSLNPDPAVPIDPAQVLGSYDYSHPVFDMAAIQAQHALPALQGHGHVWFCGAWTRYGFHEDGLRSGLDVAAQLQKRWAGPDADTVPTTDAQPLRAAA